jgi:hypothetical protein
VGATGSPLAGVVISLNGSAQASATTGANGAYAFNGLVAGSYSVQPSLAGCSFAPSVVNLNGLTASTTVNFAGSGTSCGGAASNSGATTGSLTISGLVTDSAGNPVPGARILLNGSAQGVRTTQASGAYSFQVNPGSYSLNPSGPCSFTPDVVNLNNLTASRKQNFVRSGCPAPDAGVIDSGTPDARDAGNDVREATVDATIDARDAGNDVREATVDATIDARDAGSDAREATADAPIDARDATADTRDAASDVVDTGTPDVCTPTTCAAQSRTCGPLADGCGATLQCGTCTAPQTCGGGGVAGQCGPTATPCDVSTTACMQSRDKPGQPDSIRCFQCATDNGCFDPASQGGTCEMSPGLAPASCAAALGTTSTPTETQVCLRTMKDVFSSQCAITLQETPCLCGNTDAAQCLAGTAPATGPLLPIYTCDLGATVPMILTNFTVPVLGAGRANAILGCAAAFGCDCF